MDYLNGRKSLGGYAARNTAQKMHGRQKSIVTDRDDQARVTMQRDKTTALSVLNKMALFMMKLVNRLMQARVAVVFVNYGSGGLNSITRRDGCLFNQIPPAIFNEEIESFKPIQEVFNLGQLQSRVENPRYSGRRNIGRPNIGRFLNFFSKFLKNQFYIYCKNIGKTTLVRLRACS